MPKQIQLNIQKRSYSHKIQPSQDIIYSLLHEARINALELKPSVESDSTVTTSVTPDQVLIPDSKSTK